MISVRWRKILSGLLAQPTAPFCEEAVISHLRGWAEKLGPSTQADRYGNLLFGFCRGRVARSFQPWVLTAHMDHPGFVARRRRGREVWGRFYGGVATSYIRRGAKMVWFTPAGPVRGVVESARFVKSTRDHDVRVRLEASVDVPQGTPGMWDLPAMRIRGDKLHSRACDDLVGLAMAMCAMEEFIRGKQRGKMFLLASRAEEAGLVGAMGAVRSGIIPPETAILSIETSSARHGGVTLGSGVVVRVGDRTTTFDPAATQTLCDLAGELAKRHGNTKNFAFKRALMQGGTCEASLFHQYGFPTAAVCIPLGNYHNQGRRGIASESVHLSDFSCGVRLLTALSHHSANAGERRLRKVFDRSWKRRSPLLGNR